MRIKELKDKITGLTRSYYSAHLEKETFVPGQTYVNYAGRVFDEREMVNLIDSSLDFWLTAGRYAEQFEKEFARFLGSSFCLLTNSGSSANLLAVSALTSKSLGDRGLKPGDEIITVAVAFPTTVAPIYQNSLVPVYCDVDLGTNNVNIEDLENAVSNKTKAIILAHALGNPFDIDAVLRVKEAHDLWLIEDNCDALGSTWNGKMTGTFGDLATKSFIPPTTLPWGRVAL